MVFEHSPGAPIEWGPMMDLRLCIFIYMKKEKRNGRQPRIPSKTHVIWVLLPNMAAKLTLDMQKLRYRYYMHVFHLIITIK